MSEALNAGEDIPDFLRRPSKVKKELSMKQVVEAEAEDVTVQPDARRQVPMVTSNGAITPMALLDRAMSQGAGIDIIGKFLELQAQWDKMQARKEFDAAIADAKAEIPPIIRNAKGHNEKRYADFAAIAKVVDPIITKHGLSYRFRTEQTERISVTCVLSHRAGHFEETTLSGPADTTGNKNAIQAIGSTLTYLQRYSLVQALGLAAATDDDGKAAGGDEYISPEQVVSLTKLIEETGGDVAKFCKFAKVEKLGDIYVNRYEAAVTAVNNAGTARKAKT